MVPAEDEVKGLQAWLDQGKGNRLAQYAELPPPEQFLVVMGTIPRLRAKVSALIFRRQFANLFVEASSAMRCLQEACRQVSKPWGHSCEKCDRIHSWSSSLAVLCLVVQNCWRVISVIGYFDL